MIWKGTNGYLNELCSYLILFFPLFPGSSLDTIREYHVFWRHFWILLLSILIYRWILAISYPILTFCYVLQFFTETFLLAFLKENICWPLYFYLSSRETEKMICSNSSCATHGLDHCSATIGHILMLQWISGIPR